MKRELVWAALGIRLALEIGGLVAVGWWGWQVGGPLLALAAVLVLAAGWGLLLSPRARWRPPLPVRALLELAVWVAVLLALLAVDAGGLAALFAGVLLVDLAVLLGTGEWQRPGSVSAMPVRPRAG